MADGDHFSSAGDWKNMKPKYKEEKSSVKIKNVFKPIKPPKFRSQSDIKKIAQLREDIVLTATEHDKTIDELAEAQTEIAQLKEQLEACRNRYRTKMLDSFDADLATLRARNAELEAEVASLEVERRRDALDGQAALDEANNEVARLRKSIATHKNNVWGRHEVAHNEDVVLYAALESSDG